MQINAVKYIYKGQAKGRVSLWVYTKEDKGHELPEQLILIQYTPGEQQHSHVQWVPVLRGGWWLPCGVIWGMWGAGGLFGC